jgi:hypothetical protein
MGYVSDVYGHHDRCHVLAETCHHRGLYGLDEMTLSCLPYVPEANMPRWEFVGREYHSTVPHEHFVQGGDNLGEETLVTETW